MNEKRVNGMAIASLVCGIISYLILWLLAIIFGVVAIKQIKNANGKSWGQGMAIAGIVLGIIGGIGHLILILAHFGSYVY